MPLDLLDDVGHISGKSVHVFCHLYLVAFNSCDIFWIGCIFCVIIALILCIV